MNKHQSNCFSCSRAFFSFFAIAILIFAIGCQTPSNTTQPTNATSQTNSNDTSVTLREGDVVSVTFPSATALNAPRQLVRRDGRIVIPALGEIMAAGLSPSDLEKAILQKYGKDLVTQQVTVTIDSISYVVFVNGAVLRPGKIASNRPLTALEAIMEAGGFDRTKANLKKVRVIRTEGGNKTFELDFSKLAEGGPVPVFNLQPSDIVVVPERFNLF